MEGSQEAHYPTSEAEWDKLRPKVTRLYFEDRLTLREVKEEMALQHNFKAT